MRFVIVLVLVCPLGWAADEIKPLNVKLGLWESTVVSQTSGSLPYPEQELAKLTPEQRARIEAAIKAEQAKGPQTQTTKTCLTKESLAKFTAFGQDPKGGCKPTVVRSTGSVQDLHLACEQGGVAQKGDVHIEALNPENVKGSAQINAGKNFDARMTFTAKWIGPDCGDVK